MICPKCGSTNAHISSVVGDTTGQIIEHWFCCECDHTWVAHRLKDIISSSTAAKLPDEIEINGIKYRRVEEWKLESH